MPGGNTLYGRNSRIVIGDRSFEQQTIGGEDLLSPEQRQELGVGKSWRTPLLVEDVAGGSALLRGLDTTGERQALWAVGLTSKKLSPQINLPSGWRARLSGDGRLVVLESESGKSGAQRAGDFRIHDASTGATARKFRVDALGGDGVEATLICRSPDGEQFFYAVTRTSGNTISRARLLRVDLGTGQANDVVAEFEPGVANRCTFLRL